MAILDSIWLDCLASAGLGALGGMGLDFLQEKGLQLPWRDRSTDGKTVIDPGFLAPMGVGALAAVIGYSMSQPADAARFVGAGLIAGLGGTGILKGYVNGKAAAQMSDQAQTALSVARDALSVTANAPEGDRLVAHIDSLESAHASAKVRYGIR